MLRIECKLLRELIVKLKQTRIPDGSTNKYWTFETTEQHIHHTNNTLPYHATKINAMRMKKIMEAISILFSLANQLQPSFDCACDRILYGLSNALSDTL
jgi:hypothetical protein